MPIPVGKSANDNRTLWHVGPAPPPGSKPKSTPIDSADTRIDPIAASPPPKQERFDDGDVIPGLYAAGRTTSGLAAQGYSSGLSLADATFFGRMAGRHAAGGMLPSPPENEA